MLKMQAICVDSSDPLTLANFWREVLGWRITWETENEVVLEPPEGSPQDGVAADVIFLKVPEFKQVKNRLHFDLRPDVQENEVARLEALGAQRVSVGQGDGVDWVVMSDPEGNEFDVLRAYSPEEISGTLTAE
ncbi:MAG: VOC family protein [Acidimicrobiales bacterium]|jgi:catechol 2,3-dioxygenase-like lactoylglutathione lyase family enzyme